MRVAVYVRVSTQRQAQAQTIEHQLDRLQEYSQSQGWPWKEEFIFRDDGYSGASLRRPGLDRLREQVRQAAFDRVVLTEPSRLARNYVHQMLLLEEFERGGCHVEFVDHPMSQNPHDQLLLQIRGAVAEYERSLIADRMRRGRWQKYQAGGLLPWTHPPYGYRVDPARPRDPAGVRVEPDEAAVIAEMVTWYLQESVSLLGVTKRLIARRIPTPSGSWRWNQATVRGILANPVYTGTVFLGRYQNTPARHRQSPLVPIGRGSGGHPLADSSQWMAVAQVPAIVSQEQFEQIQARLAHNQQFARRNNTAHTYLLRALVSCGTCHLACTGRSSAGQGYAYYTCRGKSHAIVSCRDEKCPSRFIPASQLDELVWQDLCEVLTHPESLAQALQRAQAGYWLPQELQARRENLRKARVSLEQQRARLTDAYLANVLQLEEYKRRHQELEQRLQGVAEQVRQLEASVGRHDELATMVQSMEAFCQRVKLGLAEATFEQKRQLVELLIDRVVVTGEEVEIRYVIPTSPTSEHLRFCQLRLDYSDFQRSTKRSWDSTRTSNQGKPANPRSKMCSRRRPQVCWQYHSMVRATSRSVVAQGPRVVHHCKLATTGTPLMPASISPIQWKPGTQMGRPFGGLKKPGLIRLRRLALLEITAHSPSAARLSAFSNTQLSHRARMGCPASCRCFTNASARFHRKTSMSKLLHFGERNRLLNRLVLAGA
ncbi:MAG: recombinase family protein [Ktedonobacteraceae bacterium]